MDHSSRVTLTKIIIFYFQKICPETEPATIVIISTTLGVPKESNVPLGKTNIYLTYIDGDDGDTNCQTPLFWN